jgi:hypothetical protein
MQKTSRDGNREGASKMHVDKETIRVTILVDRFRIVGNMFRYPGARVLDLVNIKEQAFIPITEAEVYSLSDGKLLEKVSFVGVNRNAISFFYPTEPGQGDAQ